MDKQELLYVLSLQQTKGIGSVIAKKLIQHYGTATDLYKAVQGNKTIEGLSKTIALQLFNRDFLLKAEQEIAKIEKYGLTPLYFKNSNFPKHLLNCADAPILLFQDGNAIINDYQKSISIVGTRNMSSYGADFCKNLIKDLKEFNPLIVSGFAYGVDICAHTEALKNGMDTLAVLAHGYGNLYPKEHKKYYAELKDSGGFLSEFMFDEPSYRENFLKRNRIVAGMTQATIIVESAAKGGSLVTADIAGSYNRDVFAVPGRTTDVFSKGCNNLIKNNRAALITNAEDLILELGWKKQKARSKIVQPQLFVELNTEEQNVIDALMQPTHVDSLARDLGIPIYKISNTIFQLEMKGLIQQLPGKMIKRV